MPKKTEAEIAADKAAADKAAAEQAAADQRAADQAAGRAPHNINDAPLQTTNDAPLTTASDPPDPAAAAKAKVELDRRDREDREAQGRARSPVDDNAKRSLEQLHVVFSRDVPEAARAGSFAPQDHPNFNGDYDVPDGRYRVGGGEWIYVVKGKKLILVERATAGNKYGGGDVVVV